MSFPLYAPNVNDDPGNKVSKLEFDYPAGTVFIEVNNEDQFGLVIIQDPDTTTKRFTFELWHNNHTAYGTSEHYEKWIDFPFTQDVDSTSGKPNPFRFELEMMYELDHLQNIYGKRLKLTFLDANVTLKTLNGKDENMDVKIYKRVGTAPPVNQPLRLTSNGQDVFSNQDGRVFLDSVSHMGDI
jgi:hypothetical protein